MMETWYFTKMLVGVNGKRDIERRLARIGEAVLSGKSTDLAVYMANEAVKARNEVIEEVKAGIHAPHVTEADIVY